jgi:hypothetical protein
MSQDMSDPDHNDALAGEYVLGTLDAGERAQTRALLGTDRDFAVKVELWERRLGELHLMVEPVEPDAAIWIRIKAKLPGGRPPEPQMPAGPAPEPQMPAAPPPEPDLPATPPPEPEMPFVPAGAEPPSLDAIEARISETATALASGGTPPSTFEPVPAPAADVTPAPLSDEGLPSISNTTPMPASELTPAPSPDMEQVPDTTMPQSHDFAPGVASDVVAPSPPEPAAGVVEPVAGAPEVPTATPAAAPVPETTPAPIDGPTSEVAIARRRLRRWRALAILMLLVVAAVVALVAAWRFVPDRVPPMLRPNELMRQLGITAAPGAPPPRRAAPSLPQFDE